MTVMPSVSLGQIVQSKQGKDLHLLYLVAKIQGRSLLLVNGRDRTIDNPKRKNIRHVEIHQRVSSRIASKLERNQPITNEEIRGFLNNYKPDHL